MIFIATLLLCLSSRAQTLTSTATGQPWLIRMDRDAVKIRHVECLYGAGFWLDALLRVKLLHEMGPVGNELGHDNPRTDREPFGNPCLALDEMGYARGVQAMLRALACFALADHDRRVEFLRYFARYYYGGGPAESEEAKHLANERYAREELRCWPIVMRYCQEHGLSDGTFSPLTRTTDGP